MDRTRAWIMGLSLFGIAFAGFLTLQKLFAEQCNFGCSYFLGVPTCVFGLVLFTGILVSALALPRGWAFGALRAFAVAGVAFSLYFTVKEMLACAFCYTLGLPSCAYGLVAFIVVTVLAFRLDEK